MGSVASVPRQPHVTIIQLTPHNTLSQDHINTKEMSKFPRHFGFFTWRTPQDPFLSATTMTCDPWQGRECPPSATMESVLETDLPSFYLMLTNLKSIISSYTRGCNRRGKQCNRLNLTSLKQNENDVSKTEHQIQWLI